MGVGGEGFDGQSGGHEQGFMEEEELLTAGQALLVVFVVVAASLFYAIKFYRAQRSQRRRDSFLKYNFELPVEEKKEFEKLIENRPSGTNTSSAEWQRYRLRLCSLLMQRAVKIVDVHESLLKDHQTQTLLYKRGVALPLLPQIEYAKKKVEAEIQECAAFANSLKPNWGKTIFAEAFSLREKHKERIEESDEEKLDRKRMEEEYKEELRALATQGKKKEK